MTDTNLPIEYSKFELGRWQQEKGEIITETPVSLTVNGEVWLTFMCTPVHLEALAVGFLFNEGVIRSVDEVADVRVCEAGDNVDIWLNHGVEKPQKFARTSGCTGGITFVDLDATQRKIPPSNGATLTTGQVGTLIEKLFESQDLYRRSGGVHTSALTDGQYTHIAAEDIGRHNTLDKIAGRCLLEKLKLSRHILVTTGRISSEMMQKASRLGASIVISRTSPSSLSIQMADAWGITLIGYARRTSFRLYTHPERIVTATQEPETGTEEHAQKTNAT